MAKMSSQDRSIARGSAPKQVAKVANMSGQDRSIARGSAPKQVAKNAKKKSEQPGSQHSEGMGSKAGDKNPKNKQVENCGDLWKKLRFCRDLVEICQDLFRSVEQVEISYLDSCRFLSNSVTKLLLKGSIYFEILADPWGHACSLLIIWGQICWFLNKKCVRGCEKCKYGRKSIKNIVTWPGEFFPRIDFQREVC